MNIDRNLFSIFERHRTVTLIIAPDSGAILYANPAAEKFYGYPHGVLSTMRITDISQLPADEAALHYQRTPNEEQTSCEFRHSLADGEIRFVEVDSSPILSGENVVLLSLVRDITEHKRIERDLKESDARFQTIADTVPTMVCITRLKDEVVLYTNKAHDRAFGHCGEKFIGTPVTDYYCDPAERAKMLRILQEHGAVENFRVRVKKNDGAPFWIMTSVRRITYNGCPALLGAAVRVSESKNLEDRLLSQADILQSISDSVIVTDLSFRITSWNLPAEGMYLWSAKEVLGRPISEVMRSVMSVEQRKTVYQAVQEGQAVTTEVIQYTKDGRSMVVECHSMPLRDSVGAIHGYVTINRDITKRKQTEDALKESEERLRSVLDNSLDLIYCMNLHTSRFEYISPSVEQILSYTVDEIMEQDAETAFSLIHPDDQLAVRASLEQLAQTGRAGIDYRYRIRTGEYRWISNHMTLTKDAEGRPQYRQGNTRDITEQKRMEEGLRESEQRLKYHFENSPLAVVEWDREFVVTRWSSEAERIFGWKKAEVIGVRVDALQLIYEEDLPIVADTMQRLTNGMERTVVTSNRNVMKSGTVIDCIWYNSVLLDEEGKMSSVMSLVQDATLQKRAYQALQLSEQKANAILDATSESVWLMTLSGDILGANKIAASRLGLGVADVVGKNFYNFLPPELGAARKKKIEEMTASGNPVNFEDERAGIIFQHTFNPIIEADGSITSFAIFSKDITSAKQAEKTLKASEEQFHTMANAIPQLAWIANPDGFIYWYNDRWFEYTGTTLEEMIGWGWTSVHDPDILPSAEKRWKESIATGNPFEMEFPLKGADGILRPFLTRVMPLKNDLGKVLKWFGTNTNIADRKKMEEELRQSHAELEGKVIERTIELSASKETLRQYNEQLQRLSQRLIEAQEAERRKIAFELHDEIGQVLTAVQLNLHNIVDFEDPKDIPGRLGETIALTESLLEQLKELSIDLRPWMLDQLGLVQSVRWYVDKQAQRGKLKTEFEIENINDRLAPVVEITCHRVIQESMTNILRHAAATEVRVKLIRADDVLVAEVSDNGVGFNIDALKEKPISARGIGMLGMQERIASLGGSIEIISEPGKGSTIRFHLPLCEASTNVEG